MVNYENGFRFSATCRGYKVTTGRGDDGHQERDGMWLALPGDVGCGVAFFFKVFGSLWRIMAVRVRGGGREMGRFVRTFILESQKQGR